jgi:predicted enzyme related to lactoylglutathione lyase
VRLVAGRGGWGHGSLDDRAGGFVPYIRPDDFDRTLAAIVDAGGEVLIRKSDVMGYGWFAHFRDPDGNVVGLWEDAAEEASHEGENSDEGAQPR